VQVNLELWIGMANPKALDANFEIDSELFEGLAPKCRVVRLARLDLSSRKLPQEGARLARRTLLNENPTRTLAGDERRHDPHSAGAEHQPEPLGRFRSNE
jgi:hypothetical protein